MRNVEKKSSLCKGRTWLAADEVSTFADIDMGACYANAVSKYNIFAMNRAVGSALLKGRTDSTLNQNDFAARPEIATILHRYIEANK